MTTALPLQPLSGGNLEITGLTLDSREVRPGYLFAALPGSQKDGRMFIEDALDKGAAVILTSDDYKPPQSLQKRAIFLLVPNPSLELARQAAAFYKKQPEHIAGITGTNGKSSTVSYTYDLLNACGFKAGAIGTLGILPGYLPQEHKMTTASSVSNHRILADFAERGFTHAVLEVSSHGVHQSRVAEINFSVAGFISFTPDHLDYHHTMEEYAAQKIRLFTELLAEDGTAVLANTLSIYDQVHVACKKRGLKILTSGFGKGDIYFKDPKTWVCEGKSFAVTLPHLFPFQYENLAMASAIAYAMGASPEKLARAFTKIQQVAGRLEHVLTLKNGAEIFVDYAHTGPALEIILKLARQRTPHNLSLVFGCGGNRPRERRRGMGEVAQALADRVYVVDNDPRTEDAAAIRREVLSFCPKGVDGGTRYEGIDRAMRELEKGDVLMICGKGHETTVNYNGTLVEHNDREAVLKIARDMGEVK